MQTQQFLITPRGYDDPDATRLIAAVQLEYVERYGGPDQAAVDPAEFAAPGGLFLVGTLSGEPVATGGWRRMDVPAVAELKRMYVVPAARRRGLARLVLTELERTAAAAGIVRMLLNTGPAQPEAIAMYAAAGYAPTAPFGHYADTAGALFYAKDLGAAGRA